MTSFRRISRLPTFEDYFGSLVALDASDLRQVHSAAQTFADDPDAEDPVDDDLLPAYTALTMLRQIVAEEGAGPLLTDIRNAYGDRYAPEEISKLEPLLSLTSVERERSEIREAEQSTLPILVDGKISLDYRVTISTNVAVENSPTEGDGEDVSATTEGDDVDAVTPEGDGVDSSTADVSDIGSTVTEESKHGGRDVRRGSVKFVPLFLVRLVFDEPIGGSHAVTFQADAAAVEGVIDILQDALSLVEDSVVAINESALHGHTIDKYRPR